MSDPINLEGLESAVLQLGIAAGLIKPGAQSGAYVLDPTWFSNPIGNTATALKTNGAQLADLIGTLLGSVGGKALGIPAPDPTGLGTWYPIQNPQTGAATGFNLTALTTGPNTVFGIGVSHTWALSTDINLRVWGVIPVLEVGGGSLNIVAGQDSNPLSIGLEVSGATSTIIDQYGFSFQGVRLSASLGLLPTPQPQISVVVLQLKLPTDAKASDRSLADLEQLTGQQILSTVSALFIAALADAIGVQNDPRIAFLAPVLGLTTQLPASVASQFPNVTLPILRWDQLAAAVAQGQPGRPFVDWFLSLVSNSGIVQAWLSSVQGLLGIPTPAVTGNGTRTSPWAVNIFDIDQVGALAFTISTAIDTSGVRTLYPGFDFSSSKLPLGSVAALRIAATLELAEFTLSATGISGAPGNLSFVSGFELVGQKTVNGVDAPLFEGQIAGETFRFGSLRAGLTLSDTGNGLSVVPCFEFDDLVTPAGSFASLDLTQPGQVVKQIASDLSALVNTALQRLLGIAGQASGTPGFAIGALLGIIAPDTGDPSIPWPPALDPPLSATNLLASLENPLAALGTYYSNLLSTANLVDGKVPFYYLVKQAAALFADAVHIPPTGITGSGTKADPWLAPLSTAASLPASLSASFEPLAGGSGNRLVLGFRLLPKLQLPGNSEIDLNFALDWLGLDLATGNGSISIHPQIFPGLALKVDLPKVTSPAVVGAQVSVSQSGLQVFWTPYSGLHWSMHVGGPILIVGGQQYPVGQDMDYGDQDSLEKLVTAQAQTFGRILTTSLGIAVSKAGARSGLALNGVLGLLPSLGASIPAGIVWPGNMPVLTLNSFADPLGAIRGQIQALFATPDGTKAVLQLISWAATGTVPDIAGSGTLADPFQLPLGLASGIGLSIWSDGAANTVGIGIGRIVTSALPGNLTAVTRVSVPLVNGSLVNATLVPIPGVPGAVLTSTITAASGSLIPSGAPSGATLGGLVLGLTVTPGNPISVTPLFVLQNLVLPGQSSQTINVADSQGAGQLVEALAQALNDAIQQVIALALADPRVVRIYNLLATAGLAIPASSAADPHGLNPAGWRALLADPAHYVAGRLLDLASDAVSRPDFMTVVLQSLGVTPPTLPPSLPPILEAFGLVISTPQGYVISPPAFVSLFSHPISYLKSRFQALVSGALAELVSELGQVVQPQTFGPFTLEILAGPVVVLTLPAGKAKAGNILEFSGSVRLSLGAGAFLLTIASRLKNPEVLFALEPTVTVQDTGAADFQLALAWGDGTQPPPLVFYPLPANFVDTLATIAPQYVLSTLVTQVFDPKVLQEYELAQVIMNALGIAAIEGDNKWHTKSLLGLFSDPLNWLLSDGVFGANGQLSITRLNSVLTQIPAVSLPSLGISTQKLPTGFRIAGLPWQIVIDLTADTTANQFAVQPSLSAPMQVAGNKATVSKLSFGVSLGPDYQPGGMGEIALSANIPGLASGIGLDAGYNSGFFLSITETGAATVLQLVPFAGWQKLVAAAVQVVAQSLLPDLMSKLMQALRDNGATAFADALTTAGSGLQINNLVTALLAAAPDAQNLETAALTWLTGRLSSANSANTASAIVALLKVAGVTITSTGGLISYKPSDNLPITLLVGANNLQSKDQVGLWVALDLPKISMLQASVQQTGIGIAFDPATGKFSGGAPLFNFGVQLAVPIAGEDRMPAFSFAFDPTQAKFTAGFDPIGGGGVQSNLYCSLLPSVSFGIPPEPVESWLLQLLTQVAPRYVSIVLLNRPDVSGWLNKALFPNASVTPGQALTAAGVLQLANQKYSLAPFSSISVLTVQKFLANLLKTLLQTQIQILTVDKDDEHVSITIGPSTLGAGDYGVRIVARNLALSSAPQYVFQLGAEDVSWLPTALQATPGLGLFVPVDTAPHFDQMKVQLVNAGMDFNGKNQNPLVALSRFSLGAVRPRGLIEFDFSQGAAPVNWGAEIALDNLAISLAPNTAVSGASNPVAQNLLGSGSSASNAANPPANPGFSATVSYVKGDSFPNITFYQGTDKSQTKIWITIQRTFGPLYVNKTGLEWIQDQTRLGVLFDGNVSLAGLFVGVQELDVSLNVKAPTDYTQYELDLAGLEIEFQAGNIEISGGLLKQTTPSLAYTGMVLMKIPPFTLEAFGSYAVVPVNPPAPNPTAASLFIFVNINVPLGGPPIFFVTGLAAGFGYNRDILIPGPADIGSFPLVAGAVDADFFPKDASGRPDLGQAIEKLSAAIPPRVGTYWFAAGVKFTSFELLNSFVLLFIKFGSEFEIDIVGITAGQLPPAPALAIAYFELALVASFKPADGVLSIQAQLTPNSYLLAPPCKLTGGFALVIWFGGPHQGDFVISLGGYHPAFQPPDYYPVVPRLGFMWQVDVSVGSLSISGGSYFALTPTAVMAGAELHVAYTLGPLRAWLDAVANFLIQWKPFYYDVEISISIGVEFHAEVLGVSVTLSASLGASLELWGPSTAGRVHVDWYVISFTIPIGDQNKQISTQPLGTWNDFATNFLPASGTNNAPHAAMLAAFADPAPPPPLSNVMQSSAPQGLLQEKTTNGWLVRPSSWQLQLQTTVPATGITVTNYPNNIPAGPPMGVRPMEASSVTTPLTVAIEGFNATKNQWTPASLSAGNVTVTPLLSGAPGALWSKDALSLGTPPDPGTMLVPNANVGVQIAGVDLSYTDPIGPMPLNQAFAFVEIGPLFYPQPPVWPVAAALNQDNRFARLSADIMKPAVVASRNGVLAAIRNLQIPAQTNPNLAVIQRWATQIYQQAPAFARIGVDLTSAAPAPQPGTPVQPPIVAAAFVAAQARPARLSLLGSARKYRSQVQIAGQGPLSPATSSFRSRWVDYGARAAQSGVPMAMTTAADQNVTQLFEGSTVLYAIDPGSIDQSATASLTGSLPVRVLAWNQHDELISDVVSDPGASVALPADAAKAGFQGLSPSESGQSSMVGWQSATLFTRGGRYTFIGDDCTVRPQATPIRRERGRVVHYGLMEGARVVAENRVQTAGGVESPGWIETLLPASVTAVAVALSGTGLSADSIRVKLGPSADPLSVVYDSAATAAVVQNVDGGIVLFFNAPVGAADPGAKLGVLVGYDNFAITLEGVWGTGGGAEQMAQSWNSLTARTAAVPLSGGAPPHSSVTVNWV